MEYKGYVFPDNLLYNRHHGWARAEGNLVTMGVTDLGQKLAGEIVYVELPAKGKKVVQGKPCLSFESGKWVGKIYALFSGMVVESNSLLEDNASLINEDPYGDGWIVRISVDKATLERESAGLMKTGPEFQRFVDSELQRIERERARKGDKS
ncbi:MAG: glycine cleavage system protein H [Bacillota bacterium]